MDFMPLGEGKNLQLNHHQSYTVVTWTGRANYLSEMVCYLSSKALGLETMLALFQVHLKITLTGIHLKVEFDHGPFVVHLKHWLHMLDEDE